MLVESRDAVPEQVTRWALDALDVIDADRCPHYTHTADTGFLILDVASLLALAREAKEDPDIPPPPSEVVRWLRQKAATAKREKAARFIWVA